jgi:hypothetical protein
MNNKNLKKTTIIIITMIMVALIIWIMYSTQFSNKTENMTWEVIISSRNNISENQTNIKPNIWDYLTKLEIINHQLIYWREDILSIDCSKFSDMEANKYCLDEKIEINLVSNSISWEQVLNKWDEYIVAFDCNTIYSDIWKKYCIEHQTILSESK